eukprot:136048-Prymnesium_polylepis.4
MPRYLPDGHRRQSQCGARDWRGLTMHHPSCPPPSELLAPPTEQSAPQRLRQSHTELRGGPPAGCILRRGGAC